MYIFVHFLTHIWMWNLTRYAAYMYSKDNPLWWCYVSSIASEGWNHIWMSIFLLWCKCSFRIFSSHCESKAQRPFFVHFFGARQWLIWWGSSAYLINTYISRRKIQQCHVALRNHVALENVQSGRVPKIKQMACGCSFHSPLTSKICKFP